MMHTLITSKDKSKSHWQDITFSCLPQSIAQFLYSFYSSGGSARDEPL
jgi:hypothetical protein